jgi:hypothetical protein
MRTLSHEVSIETQPGEAAESVARRLAEKINSQQPFSERKESSDSVARMAVEAKGSSISFNGVPGNYFVAGTETGLGIPPPPLSLSCRYDSETDRILIEWRNPAEAEYDSLSLFENGLPAGVLDGTATSHSLNRQGLIEERDIENLHLRLVGVRDGVPSGCAAIYLHGNRQEELIGFPYWNGLRPNWEEWSTGGEIVCEAKYRPEAEANRPYPQYLRDATHQPFLQAVTVTGGESAGILRRFVGLKSGATYRPILRLAASQQENKETAAVLLRATYELPEDSGLAPLPSRAASAEGIPGRHMISNRIEFADSGSSKETVWKQITASGNSEGGTLTLPEDCSSLIVWLGPEEGQSGSFLLDWIALEELPSSAKCEPSSGDGKFNEGN